jgi:hypothetical protein
MFTDGRKNCEVTADANHPAITCDYVELNSRIAAICVILLLCLFMVSAH